jgi:hypothetical protein
LANSLPGRSRSSTKAMRFVAKIILIAADQLDRIKPELKRDLIVL